MGAPLTATRPAAIHVSASRREASPARAITFATRSALPPALAGEGRAGGTRLRGMAELIDNGAPDSRRGSLMSFMDEAVGEARAAGGAGEVPIGCVLVRDGAIVARAFNRTMLDRDPTAHAEMLAIRAAGTALGSERLVDCDLYVTLE